ncbi:hypothetical protein Pmani_018010 [Petrolisthes manimaculis]|uniref:Uncharacterized protein n=1 Tax=Petrolisthes manimaculis TaxID=1843537 RepID=A0AAE1PKN4_9EUCA|nr:hypothetical protein Pmani_018010 [Petrolisthes manimaculis]
MSDCVTVPFPSNRYPGSDTRGSLTPYKKQQQPWVMWKKARRFSYKGVPNVTPWKLVVNTRLDLTSMDYLDDRQDRVQAITILMLTSLRELPGALIP